MTLPITGDEDRCLPTTGTLTFLFTDIEGSTRRWAQHPESMSGALVRHDELLREAIESHGGGVSKHTGDGVSAVFANPCDALAAATAAQQSLQTQAELEGERRRGAALSRDEMVREALAELRA